MKKEMKDIKKKLLAPIIDKVLEPMLEHSQKEWTAFKKANPKMFPNTSHLETNEVRSIGKRSVSPKRELKSEIADLFKRAVNFKWVTYNPDEGVLVFEFGGKGV